MSLTMYSKFTVKRTAGVGEWIPVHTCIGMITLFAALHAERGSPVTIVSGDVSTPLTHASDPTDPDWSLWTRVGDFWSPIKVKAANLDALAREIYGTIEAMYADEIRICPPNTPLPNAITHDEIEEGTIR